MKKNPSGALLSALPMPDRDHTQGPADAAIQLVEYGDYECSYCGEAYPVVKAIQEHLGERLCFAFRNFPLGNPRRSHPPGPAPADLEQVARPEAAQQPEWFPVVSITSVSSENPDFQIFGWRAITVCQGSLISRWW